MLDQHDAIVQRQLDRFRGRLIKNMGDGLLASFDGPARAVRCASAIRDALRGLGLGIRAGLHAGEIEVRGNDVSGITVNITQRVQAVAEPGEVLASRTVVDLVMGSGIEFDVRPDHHLKGLPGTWQLYAVAGSAGTRDRTALRSRLGGTPNGISLSERWGRARRDRAVRSVV